MDLRFSEDHEMLRTSAKDFLIKECPTNKLRELEKDEKGYNPEVWRKMAELGWMGLNIPEKYGGSGLSFQELSILLEEMGKTSFTGPFLSTIASSFHITDAGTEEQKAEFLSKVASGNLILCTALLETSGTISASEINTTAEAEGDNFIIKGVKLFVEMAHVSDYIICAAKTGAKPPSEETITLFIIDAKSPGVHCEIIPTISRDKLCEVRFDNVSVPRKNILGGLNRGWPIVQNALMKGAIAKCAESVGGMQKCVDMTVAYSKERVQYDRPIGYFQAIQHLIADMWISMQTSRFLVYEVAWMESEGLPCAKEVSMAKSYVNEMYKYVTKWAVRLHGGIGTSSDHDVSFFYRSAKAADTAFGGTDFHRELVAEKIGLL